MAEVGLAMAGRTERGHVLEDVCVRLFEVLGLNVVSHGNDMVDVGIAAEVVAVSSASNASVAVPFEGVPSRRGPPLAVRFVATTGPVGMAVAGERVGEPRPPAVLAAEDRVTGRVARVAFDRVGTDRTLEFAFAARPLRFLSPGSGVPSRQLAVSTHSGQYNPSFSDE